MESWTNEKHVKFLNTMEASFVCFMFETKNKLALLDRFVPDTSDSTLDRIVKPRKTTSIKKFGPVRRMDGGAVRKARRLTSQPFISSQLDQVVPEFYKSKKCAEISNEKGCGMKNTDL